MTFFNRSVVDGRIAESIVEQIFLSQGYDVFRFGIENTAPGLPSQMSNAPKSRLIIKSMPDFIVRKNGEAFLLEVKFRKDGGFDLSSIGNDYPFDGVFFIVVSLANNQCEISCISLEELESGRRLDGGPDNRLGDRPEFVIDKEVLENLRRYAFRIFAGYKGVNDQFNQAATSINVGSHNESPPQL